MKIDLKLAAPYIIIIGGFLVSWGMWGEKIQALEKKTDNVEMMMQDIAVIKNQITEMNKKLDRLLSE